MGALCPDRGGVLLGHHHDRHGVAKLGRAQLLFNMLEPIVSIVVSAAAYHYAISRRDGLGCLLILASMLLIALNDRRRAERAGSP